MRQYYIEDRISGRSEVLSLRTLIQETVDLTDGEVDKLAEMMVGDSIFMEPHIQIRRERNV